MNVLVLSAIFAVIIGILIIIGIIIFFAIKEWRKVKKLNMEVKPQNESQRYEFCSQKPTAHAINRQCYGYAVKSTKPKPATTKKRGIFAWIRRRKQSIERTNRAKPTDGSIEKPVSLPTSKIITDDRTKQDSGDDSEATTLHKPADL